MAKAQPVSKKIPSRLATPTDLTADTTQSVSIVLNPLIADFFALYVKTKNFHWHVAGPHFRDYHLLLDEQADQIFAAIDILAERVRRVGGTTIRSIGQIAQLQHIEDDNRDYVPAPEMLALLQADGQALVERLRAAHTVCENHRDVATTSVLETLIDEAERRVWFLFEAAQTA